MFQTLAEAEGGDLDTESKNAIKSYISPSKPKLTETHKLINVQEKHAR